MTRSWSDCDFVELLWENGQILTRVLSSTGSEDTNRCTSFSLHGSNAEMENGWDSIPKRARFASVDCVPDQELPGHDKMNPHPKYIHEDSQKECYHNELLARLSGDNLNNEVITTYNSYDKQLVDCHVVPSVDNLNLEQANACKFFGGEPQVTRHRGGQICDSPLQEWQASCPYIRSKEDSSKIPVPASRLSNSKMRQQEPDDRPDNGMGTMNFSYFFKLADLGKAKAQINEAERAMSRPGLSGVELKSNSGNGNGTNPCQTRPIEPSKEHCEDGGDKVALGNTGSASQAYAPKSSFEACPAKGQSYIEKSVEPLIASSSACSRAASNYLSSTLKTKCEESEESEYPSENFEEEPASAFEAMPSRGGSAGSKRNRSAEVHSLSEKRRRDRINKKMRSLQELIPNCKKVDKVSILDEAIDYLKTLQLQVQVMSMGTGLCMPPLMLPTAMQQIQAAHLPHFSFMGMGMGMGMRMGMGMGMGMGIGCSPGQFQRPPLSGGGALPGIAATAPHMLGLPSQVIPMSFSSAPFIPLQAGSLTPILVPSIQKDVSPVKHSRSSPSSDLKGSVRKTNVECSKSQTSSQATTDGSSKQTSSS